MPQNLSKEEFDALKNLKQILLQKSDKGNSIVIVDRDVHIKKMENFLSDESKFQKTTVKDENFFNFITSQEKQVKFIKNLLGETQRHLKPVGTRPGIMYGSC